MLCRHSTFAKLSIRWQRSVIVAVVAVISLLLSFISTDAAVWVRIRTDPSNPIVGESVLIRAQMVDTQGADCLYDPDAAVVPNRTAYTGLSGPDLEEMKMHIHGPGAAEPESLTLIRREDDTSIWEGRFVFPEPGRWSLQMAYPSWSSSIPGAPGPPEWVTDTCTGAEQIVTVLPSRGSCSTPYASPSTRLDLVEERFLY